MSIEKQIEALQNPDAPESSGPVALKAQTIGRGAGRPPIGGETAIHHVHIRTTAQRKSAWVQAAKPRTLAEWATENLDRAAKGGRK